MPTSTVQTQHTSLDATFIGIDTGVFTQYRGIRYGTITERFALPALKTSWNGEQVDCTNWGPRCPQLKYDVGHILREPEGNVFYDESEDEFECLNLDVTVPTKTADLGSSGGGGGGKGLPVFFWIHGGSQIISYGNGASKIGDVS